MGYTYMTDLAPPKKLHRSLGTDLPYIPRWVIEVCISGCQDQLLAFILYASMVDYLPIKKIASVYDKIYDTSNDVIKPFANERQ